MLRLKHIDYTGGIDLIYKTDIFILLAILLNQINYIFNDSKHIYIEPKF